MESLKELYRIGPGPSSSHTLAVRNACLLYLDKYPNYSKYYVTLCGSLALTGKGHMSDKIIEKVFGPQNVEISFQRQMYMDKPNVLIFHTDNMHYSTFIQGFLLPQKSILIIPLP